MSFKNLTMEHLECELATLMLKLYPTHEQGFVKIGQKKWFMPYSYVENGDKIYSFETRPDDIWVITFPRSGTTVTQELVWLVANDMNFDEAHRRKLFERFPFLEQGVMLECKMLVGHTPDKQYSSFEYVRNLPSPRFIKSHFSLDLLPTVVNSDCKIIYIARNPRDVVVSWYHFQKDMKYFQYQGTFEEFCNNFLNDHTLWSPYWEHVKEAWAMRNRANMLFLFYEDLRKDLSGSIKKVAAFFGKTYNGEQIAKLVDHLEIENFRKNPMVNNANPKSEVKPEMFIRQGKINGWKKIFTPEIEERFNKWIADNLKNTDLIFPI